MTVVLRPALDVKSKRGDAVVDRGRRIINRQPPDDGLVVVFARMDEGGCHAVDQVVVAGRLDRLARRSDTSGTPCAIACDDARWYRCNVA